MNRLIGVSLIADVEQVITKMQSETKEAHLSTMNQTPEKYRAEKPKYEQKEWLYEKYWGELLSQQTIADEVGVHRTIVRDAMHEHGIPRRPDGYTRDNAMSAFSGFYSDTAARGDGDSHQQFDADYDRTEDHEWGYSHWKGIGD